MRIIRTFAVQKQKAYDYKWGYSEPGNEDGRPDEPDSASPGDRLSSREIEILAGVAQGLLNKEIAAKYNISIHTVITHRKNIARKTGVKTIAGLTAYAILNNII